jgi:hypothetical protein
MSARDRAFSRLDRQDLQEILQADTDRYGERNTWATNYRIARESKLVYLDELFKDLNLNHIGQVLTRAISGEGHHEKPSFEACSKVIAGLRGRNRLYEKPQLVKQRAPEIKALIVEGYDELKRLGYDFPHGH